MAAGKPVPKLDAESAPFWEAAKSRQLSLPRCRECGRYHFYPRALCPHCRSEAIAFEPVSGRGTIYSFTVQRRPAGPEFAAEIPYVVALVDLEEGPRMLSNVVGTPPDQIRIGQALTVTFVETDGVTLPAFEVAK